MTIAQALKKYPKIESDLLLAHVLKQPKEFLYIHPKQKLTAQQLHSYESMAAKRAAGMPVAYLLGHKYFYGLKFKVNKHVLIPRPETEWIIDQALKIIKGKRKARILDIGTGSGCIAVTLAKLSPAEITATDISSAALKVAKENAQKHKAYVKFIQRDLLKGINQKFDLIIANLPYVPKKEYAKLKKGLRYEPLLALVDSADDLSLFEKLFQQLPSRLKRNSTILLEIDPSFAKTLKTMTTKALPRKTIQIVKDIHKLDRFIAIH